MNASSQDVFNFVAYQLAWFAVRAGRGAGPRVGWRGIGAAGRRRAPRAAARRGRAAADRLRGGHRHSGRQCARAHEPWSSLRAAGSGFAPYWMVSLWIAFATTLNHSLRWLRAGRRSRRLPARSADRWPISAGAKLGALSIAMPIPRCSSSPCCGHGDGDAVLAHRRAQWRRATAVPA